MKTYLNHSQNNIINNNLLTRKRIAQAEHKTGITREEKQLYRPAQAISFGGSAGLVNGIKKLTKDTIETAYKHEGIFDAIYSLLIAGIIKPIAVINQKGSEEKDKQIIATKNFLQAFIGSFLGFTVGGQIIDKAFSTVETDLDLIKGVVEGPDGKKTIKVFEAQSTEALEIAKDMLFKENKKVKGYAPTIDEIVAKSKELVDDFTQNRLKHFSKNPDFISELKSKDAYVEPGKIKAGLIKATENLPEMLKIHPSKNTVKDGYRTFWKRSSGFITTISKARISSILLPTVMAFLFAKRNLEKQKLEQAKQNSLANNATFKSQNEQFQKMLNKNQQISFKGKFNSSIASAIECMGNSKTGEKIAHWMAGFNKPTARMADMESLAITAYWLADTTFSKKIEPSQKLGLNVHTALVTAVSSTAAFILDWALDFFIDKKKENYEKTLNKIVENIKNNMPSKKPEAILKEFEDSTGAVLADVHKLGIIDSVKKAVSQLKPEDTLNPKQILQQLQETNVFRNTNITENLISDVANSIRATIPFEEEIKTATQYMVNSKDIAKKLAETDLLNNQAVAKTVGSLVQKYGKILAKFKSMTIFTLVVRFLVPVLLVPHSGKLKKKVVELRDKKQNNEIKNQPKK